MTHARPKIVIKEDPEVKKAQQDVGAVMDKMVKREQWLRRHKAAIVGDDSLLLYRLPLNEEQLKTVYYNILDETKKSIT